MKRCTPRFSAIFMLCRNDATEEDMSFGRLLNDSVQPNCVPKLIVSGGIACCNIAVGEELRYNYSRGGDYPRRKVSAFSNVVIEFYFKHHTLLLLQLN
jgi:hypothetical protein